MADPKITKLELHTFSYEVPDMGRDGDGFNLVYAPGGRLDSEGQVLRLFTDTGLVGECLAGRASELSTLPQFWHYLKGKSALQRERINDDVKRALRQAARMGVGPIDMALWDIAGKLFDVPIHKLLGGYKESVPCYASTYHGDHAGGLDSPEAYAAFAQQCRDMGYPAFKIHGWNKAPVAQEVATVLAVREAVGTGMDLMVDPACELTTFGDALKVGRACDEADFFWYEDPFRDGGISQFAHRKLRQLIRTPLLQTEHVRSLEPHIDFALADATDYIRGDIGYDGITGVMKLAHAAESLGMDIEFHGPHPAARQCMAAIRNTNYYEMGLVHPNAPASHPDELYLDHSDRLDSIDERGHVPVGQAPGLGAQINWEWVEAHRTDVQTYD